MPNHHEYKSRSKKAPAFPTTRKYPDEYDEEQQPLFMRHGDDSFTVPPSNTLLRVGSAVTVIISLLLITVGAAMYKLAEEEAIILRAHDSLLSENYDELCILKKSSSELQGQCSHPTTKFFVPGAVDGSWPVGFSFVVLKDSDGTSGDKSVLHTENGRYIHNPLPEGEQCKAYMTELCLDGAFVLYASSKVDAPQTSYVIACDSYRVESAEALDFSVSAGKCSSESFEDVTHKVSIRAHLPDLTQEETDTQVVMNNLAGSVALSYQNGNNHRIPCLNI